MTPRLNSLILAGTGVLLALAVSAQQPASPPDPSTSNTAPVSAERKGKARGPAKVSEIIGSEVHNLGREKLGHVDDVAIVLEDGRVALVILAFGGLRGVEDKLTAVPPQVLQFNADNKIVRLKAETEKFATAPRFEAVRWEEALKPDQVAGFYSHYGQKQAAARGGQTPAQAGKLVERTAKLIGAPVRNSQDEKVGEVNDLVIDLAGSRILAVIVSSGDFLGVSGELSAVPAAALRYNSQRDTLVLDATKDSLTKAPHFKPADWPDMSDRAYADSVHAAFGLQPPAARRADNTRRNARDRDGKTLTPLDQGSSAEDIKTTAQIRKALVARDDLSVTARNVKIITQNGKVTLRGPVMTAEEKQIIEQIAANLTRQDRVDSQLEVK